MFLPQHGGWSAGTSDPTQETAPSAGNNFDLQHIPWFALRSSLSSHTVNLLTFFPPQWCDCAEVFLLLNWYLNKQFPLLFFPLSCHIDCVCSTTERHLMMKSTSSNSKSNLPWSVISTKSKECKPFLLPALLWNWDIWPYCLWIWHFYSGHNHIDNENMQQLFIVDFSSLFRLCCWGF